MIPLVFASNNINKAAELRAVLKENFKIITLKDAGIDIDIPEPYDSLEENAYEKSKTVFNLTGKNCFSEDSGLEVLALKGEPGVRSARYAGEHAGAEENIDKLLMKLNGIDKRDARFRTVISLRIDKEEFQFEGVCKGHITKERKGKDGFGYDPVFIPEGSEKTFAEMNMDEKNMYSHRRKAAEKFINFLQKYNVEN